MFLLWGLWHGFFLMAERILIRPDHRRAQGDRPSPWRYLGLGVAYGYALLVVLTGWVFFRSVTYADAALFFHSLAGLGPVTREARVLWLELSPKVVLAMLAGILVAYPVVPWARQHIRRRCASAPWLPELGEWLVLTLLGLLALVMVAGGAYNPFIYFRF